MTPDNVKAICFGGFVLSGFSLFVERLRQPTMASALNAKTSTGVAVVVDASDRYMRRGQIATTAAMFYAVAGGMNHMARLPPVVNAICLAPPLLLQTALAGDYLGEFWRRHGYN